MNISDELRQVGTFYEKLNNEEKIPNVFTTNFILKVEDVFCEIESRETPQNGKIKTSPNCFTRYIKSEIHYLLEESDYQIKDEKGDLRSIDQETYERANYAVLKRVTTNLVKFLKWGANGDPRIPVGIEIAREKRELFPGF